MEDNVLEGGKLALQEVESPQFVPTLRHEPNAEPWKQEVTAPAHLRPESRAPGRSALPDQAQEGRPRATGNERQNGLLRRRPIISAIGVVLLASAIGGGYVYLDHAGHFETTDDAFIAARQSALAPKVSGYITAVPVTDNEHVAAGDVIARIDDRDYRIALEQAHAQVAAAQASIENIDAQLDVQQAQISANEAQEEQAQAALVFAQQQAARYQELAQKGSGSVQNAQQYTSQLRQQQAALASAQATLKLAQRQIEALKAQHSSAVANLAQAGAQRDQAQLNLSYTTVTAAQPGRVVNLSAAVGQFAQPGTDLTMFVPDQIWVTANFKEIQLDRMRPGEPVTLEIDAYQERAIRGHVDSISPDPGPRSRCCRPRMLPATTSRSSNACRSRSSWTIRRRMSRSARACR